MSRHYQEIVKELHERTHRDGYYGDRNALTKIVDELVNELTYTNLLKNQEIPHLNDNSGFMCSLPIEKNYSQGAK